MDPEKQPLLSPVSPTVTDERCYRSFRPLTNDEVLAAHHAAPWRRARLCLLMVLWVVVAALLSMAVSILMRSTCSSGQPIVPPVHMSFANLVSSVQAV